MFRKDEVVDHLFSRLEENISTYTDQSVEASMRHAAWGRARSTVLIIHSEGAGADVGPLPKFDRRRQDLESGRLVLWPGSLHFVDSCGHDGGWIRIDSIAEDGTAIVDTVFTYPGRDDQKIGSVRITEYLDEMLGVRVIPRSRTLQEISADDWSKVCEHAEAWDTLR